MTNDLTITTVSNEPRVLDTDLAERLGMADLHKIRPLIRDSLDELRTFGEVSARRAETTARGGRPGTAFYLNEEQALLVCMLSRTAQAKEVRAHVIRVFTAYRRGQLVPVQQQPAIPTTFAEALRLAAEEVERREEVERKLIEAQPKIGFYDGLVEKDGEFDFNSAAKMVGQGPNVLRRKLLAQKVLYRERGTGTYLPYSEFVKAGYFRLSVKHHGDHVHRQVRVTTTGLGLLRERAA